MSGLRIQKNAVDIIDYVTQNTIRISEHVGSKNNTCSFIAYKNADTGSPITFSLYDEIIIDYYTNTTHPDFLFGIRVYTSPLNLFAGVITSLTERPITPDGSEVEYTIECSDYTVLLNRKLVNETWENKTTAYIFKDIIKKYTSGFNYTILSINPNEGVIIPKFTVHYENVTDVLNELSQIEGVDWYVDYVKSVWFLTPSIKNGVNVNRYTITDAILEELVDNTFSVSPDLNQIANSIKLFYKKKYDTGTVEVTNASKIITGIGTLWTANIVEGAKFKVDGRNPEYTVQSIDSDTQITLSSEYNEASSGIGVSFDYILYDSPAITAMKDTTSINTMKGLMGGDGIYEIAIREDNTYSYEQARSILKSYLNTYANTLYHFNFKCNSSRINACFGVETSGILVGFLMNVCMSGRTIKAGDVITFDLNNKLSLHAEFVVQDVSMEFTGAMIGEETKNFFGYDVELNFPSINFDISFSSRLYDFIRNMREIFRYIRQPIVSENMTQQDIIDIVETLTITDATTIEEMTTPIAVAETLTISDSVTITESELRYYDEDKFDAFKFA